MTSSVADWVESVQSHQVVWLLMRLTGTDTLAVGSRSSGLLVPRALLERLAPEALAGKRVPPLSFEARLAGDPTPRAVQLQTVRGVFFQRTHDESRFTGFGAVRPSPLVRTESTGALVAFAIGPAQGDRPRRLDAWLAGSEAEERLLEARFGPVEPDRPCVIASPPVTESALPDAGQLAAAAKDTTRSRASLEERLLARRAGALDRLGAGLPDGVASRRWADRLLAHLVRDVLAEHRGLRAPGIVEKGEDVSLVSGGAGPDVRVASVLRFRAPAQVMFTMQRGLDEAGLQTLLTAGTRLVVPSALLPFYPARLRPQLTAFESFIRELAPLA